MTDRAAALAEALGADVAVVAVALRVAAAQARRDCSPLHGRVVRLLDDFEAAQLIWNRKATQSRWIPVVAGTSLADTHGRPAPSSGLLGAAQAARRVGVTDRAIRKAAASGRLVGRLGGDGRWWFTEEAMMAWLASRTPRRSA